MTGAEGHDQTGEPHAPARPEPENQQGDHLLLRGRLPRRPGSHDRTSRRVRLLAELRPGAQTRLARTTAGPDLRRSDHAQAGQPRIRPARRGSRPVGLPPNRRPAQFPARQLIPAARGPRWSTGRRTITGSGPLVGTEVTTARGRAAHRAGQTAQPVAALLASDRMPAARRQGRLEGAATPTRPGREPTTAWPRPPISASRGGSRPSSRCSSSTSGTEARARAHEGRTTFRPSRFPTASGVGSYRIDLHPSTGGDNYIDISSLPFQIPLGALIPRRVENLLPACKNLGTTHITNGCYRLHPVEWAIGEAAGALAAFCLEQKESPRGVRNSPNGLSAFQARLVSLKGSRSPGRACRRVNSHGASDSVAEVASDTACELQSCPRSVSDLRRGASHAQPFSWNGPLPGDLRRLARFPCAVP